MKLKVCQRALNVNGAYDIGTAAWDIYTRTFKLINWVTSIFEILFNNKAFRMALEINSSKPQFMVCYIYAFSMYKSLFRVKGR